MSAYFVYPFAAFCEIAGCFAFWAWWRLDRSALWLLPGLVVLALFAWLLAQVPTDEAGRAYAAYGGVYVAASLLWLWTVEGTHARSLGCDRRCGGARRRGNYPVRPARLIPQSRSSYLSRLRLLPDPDHLPALDPAYVHARPAAGLGDDQPPPRILLLYGSLRERSYSRLAVEEAARLLQLFAAETRIFDPADLPLPDQVAGDDHPAVAELREHAFWSEGMVWCSPERHGQISAIMKAQIDHLPLEIGGMRPTQGRTLAVMQVSGGSQSFNSVNTLRLLGRWMRMVTIPNQSSVPKAYQEFDDAGRMNPSPLYDRIVDVMEELVRFTVLLRPHGEQLVDRYSERKAGGRPVERGTDLSAIAVDGR